MGKYIDRKLAGSKRSKMPDSLKCMKRQRKRLDHQKSQRDELTGTVDADIFSEEDDASMQLPVYDNLLRALGSGRDALEEDYFCNKSAKNQGDIRIPYTVGAVFKSASTFAEEDVGEDSESDQSAQFGNEIIEEGGGGKTSTHGDELYDQDYMPDSQFDVNTPSDESANNISFHRHFGHVLTNEEVNKLTKDSLKFKWEMLVKEMPMSKLVGTGQELSIDLNGDHFYRINPRLHNHWKNLSINFNSGDLRFSKMRLFFSLCNSYRNIMHCDKWPFYMKGRDDDDDDSVIMDAYIMHALDHVHRIRDLVLKHNAKLRKYDNSKNEENAIHCGDIYLDQGFTRPKVLLLLPLASIAYRVVKRLIQLYPLSHKGNVAHMDRFSEEFGADDAEESLKSTKQEKPVDFEVLFGGNNNDHFMIGIKFTKGSIKLYNNFYLSDIIVASPLGLITKIGEMEIDKEKNVDYLSSIEVLIIDHADIVAMQNWSHLSTVIEHLNRMPSQQHGTDVMRIKQWYLNGHARFYRQTILLGSFLTPDMNALFNRLCVNYEGKVKMVSQHKGVLHRVLLQARQLFERFEASSIINADDARLEYFSNKVFPKMKDSIEGRTLIFISSYFEFVRIRNFLKSQNASFCLLSEYTKQSDVSRSRLWFFEGKRKIMLYTERAHFYHRYKIRGIRNLIFYSLPERKEFYSDIVNMLEGSEHMSCSVLFSRYDLYRLERIVGTAAANRMSSSEKATFIFC